MKKFWKKWIKIKVQCPNCEGKGYILYTQHYPFKTGWCPACEGEGFIK